MTRKLVTVRQVSVLAPIPGADRIQTATVDGWKCVVSVTDFQVGNFGLYFEIDCLLPLSDSRWKFLASRGSKKEDIRVKTLKIRNVLSQGLLMPIALFPEVSEVMDRLEKDLGTDEMHKRIRSMSFEELLGVRKYEAPAPQLKNPNTTDFLSGFPDFILKTDQERVQNMPGVFDEWKNAVFQESTKMDGSSMTVYFIRTDSPHFAHLPPLPPGCSFSSLSNGRVGVCSRNRDVAEIACSSTLFWTTALAKKLPATLNDVNRNIAIQGELCGSSIQKNFEGFEKGVHDFYLFSVWDIDAQRYLPPREVHEVWAPRLSVQHVPVLGYWPLREIAGSVTEVLERADGKGIHGRKREGIVLKHVDGAFSFKAISNSYLLKHGE